jgi:hypothetical protein
MQRCLIDHEVNYHWLARVFQHQGQIVKLVRSFVIEMSLAAQLNHQGLLCSVAVTRISPIALLVHSPCKNEVRLGSL